MRPVEPVPAGAEMEGRRGGGRLGLRRGGVGGRDFGWVLRLVVDGFGRGCAFFWRGCGGVGRDRGGLGRERGGIDGRRGSEGWRVVLMGFEGVWNRTGVASGRWSRYENGDGAGMAAAAADVSGGSCFEEGVRAKRQIQ